MNEVELVKNTEICKNCKNIVVGKGNINSKILFVGEAPGKNEDEQGIPFVGAAGKNLDLLLKGANLDLTDIYITNILKCRPPKNRDPTIIEIEAHTPWLLKQIKEMRPEVICSLGNYATKFFLALGKVDKMKSQPGISKVHGKPKNIEIDGIKIKLIPLFHPAAIIYNRSLINEWKKDLEIIKSEIKY
ncbi:uracil-DNA glycosylase [archaeon]|jgi:uracil-DNA glycosylase|nr:uracil-DNA glycosylase [archaeon]MBT6824149.1 uracil-DNA glycosylase [archaeon]MBT7107007.1 uracil-DNA glycosylase [archaeon]MBT7297619.1 uracil-DNA glycosylase [archaeon]